MILRNGQITDKVMTYLEAIGGRSGGRCPSDFFEGTNESCLLTCRDCWNQKYRGEERKKPFEEEDEHGE